MKCRKLQKRNANCIIISNGITLTYFTRQNFRVSSRSKIADDKYYICNNKNWFTIIIPNKITRNKKICNYILLDNLLKLLIKSLELQANMQNLNYDAEIYFEKFLLRIKGNKFKLKADFIIILIFFTMLIMIIQKQRNF